MKYLTFYPILCTFLLFSISKPPKKYKLVWSDEFSTEGLPDASKWTYDVGDGCPRICGWGNNEWQYYTEADIDNASVKDGKLTIEARPEKMGGKEYTSARLLTRNRASWKYGYFEMRAKTPVGLGTWSAIWLLPEKNTYGEWPGSGEIDLLEHVGFAQDSIFGTVHTEAFNHIIGTQKGGGVGKIKPHEDYHLYAINWTPEKMDFLFDGKIYFTFYKEAMANNKQWPFDQPFHIILNLAVGGNLGGKMGVDEKAFPARFSIDYVRVYQKKD